jgi:hypothetical protein
MISKGLAESYEIGNRYGFFFVTNLNSVKINRITYYDIKIPNSNMYILESFGQYSISESDDLEK